MSAALDDAWFDRVTAALGSSAAEVGAPDATAEIEVVVSGGEPGKVVTRWTVDGGRLLSVRVAVDDAAPADVTIPLAAADLAAILSGEADPAVAFMRGDLKPEGSAAAWFAFVSAMNQPATRAALAG